MDLLNSCLLCLQVVFLLWEVLRSFICLFSNPESDFQFMFSTCDQLAARDCEITYIKQYKAYSSRLCKERQFVNDALDKASFDLDRANKGASLTLL